MRTCPNCGHEQATLLDRCKHCGTPLPKNNASTLNDTLSSLELPALPPLPREQPAFPQPLLGAPCGSAHVLVLHFLQSSTPLVIKPTQNIYLGRRNSPSDDCVDIDLTPYDAWQHGVSRFHALLTCSPHLSLMDMRSRNGTYIGTERLVPMTPYGLQNGDQIRLANLALQVYVKTKETKSLAYV
jgi:hypothetical protein